jgi:hypothetical protein
MLWHADNAAELAASVEAAATRAGFRVRPAQGPMFALGGDHHVFARAGVPSLFIFGGFHADYNQPSDLPDRIDVARLARLVVALADYLVSAPAP